jgi:hypothetical protein
MLKIIAFLRDAQSLTIEVLMFALLLIFSYRMIRHHLNL